MRATRTFPILSTVSGAALLMGGAAYAQPATTAPDATPATAPPVVQTPATAPTIDAGNNAGAGAEPMSAGAGPSTGAAAGSGGGSGVEEIVVTAQRREQRLQDVPLAVTAVTGTSLESNRVRNATDLTGIVPGLFVRPNAGGLGSPSFSLRARALSIA